MDVRRRLSDEDKARLVELFGLPDSPRARVIDREAGRVAMIPPRDKVCILGLSARWWNLPIDDPEYEVWGCNQLHRHWGLFATRWFEIHPLSVLDQQISAEQIRDLETSTMPIYMDRCYPSIPQSVRYPIERVSAGHRRHYSSSFCYQFALAIHEGFKEIGLSVDFSRGTARERLVEWRSVMYWLGLAEGLGINVIFPDGGESLEHPCLYGLEYWDEVEETRDQIARFREAQTDSVKRRWWWRRPRAAQR